MAGIQNQQSLNNTLKKSNMKFKKSIIITLLVSFLCANVSAHDIAVKNEDGVTIYYKWTNNNTELSVSEPHAYYW